jgi:D-sedoheptulose 7-phosphate isomerase
MKIFSIGFLGNKGGKVKKLCDISLIVGSKNTPRIQEFHIFLGHLIS